MSQTIHLESTPSTGDDSAVADALRVRRHIVVGTGAIAHAHVSGIVAKGRGVVTHAVDLDGDRAAEFAARHGIAQPGSDLGAALADRPDLAHICTPPGTHVPLAAACLEAGVPVLLEKPPALSLAEMDRLAETAQRTGVDVAVVFQHRFGAATLRLAQMLADGVFGRVHVATCDTLWFRPPEYFAVPWRGKWELEGGGPTMGHGIHQFDHLLSLLGPWSQVSAMAGRLARDTSTEDVSAAVLQFESGTLSTIMNSLLSPRETAGLRLDTERATVELVHLAGYIEDEWAITPAPGHEDVAPDWEWGRTPTSSHIDQMTAIHNAMDAGEPLPVSLREARDTLELVAAIYASAFTGRVVRRGEIGPDHPFYARMDGTGAPWAHADRNPGSGR